MPDTGKDSGKDAPDQWSVVQEEPPMFDLCQHVYRIVRLRNQAGKLSSGVQCIRCGDVERVTDRQWASRGAIHYGAER